MQVHEQEKSRDSPCFSTDHACSRWSTVKPTVELCGNQPFGPWRRDSKAGFLGFAAKNRGKPTRNAWDLISLQVLPNKLRAEHRGIHIDLSGWETQPLPNSVGDFLAASASV